MNIWHLLLTIFIIQTPGLFVDHKKRNNRHGKNITNKPLQKNYHFVVTIFKRKAITGMGVIIHKRWVLAAASIPVTINDAINGDLHLRGNASDSNQDYIEHVVYLYFRNRKYTTKLLNNVALFKIYGKFRGIFEKPIPITTSLKFRVNCAVTIVGWRSKGEEKDLGHLKRDTVRLVSLQECIERNKDYTATNNSMCTVNVKEHCSYIESPVLLHNNKLIGLGSYRFGQCDQAIPIPRLYTRVIKYVKWINKHIALH